LKAAIGKEAERMHTAHKHSDYYTRKSARLLRQFDRHFVRATRRLAHHHGEELAAELTAETRRRFEQIIPELPYIGGSANYFTPVMVINGWLVSLHRAMAERGLSAEDTARVAFEATDDFFSSKPQWLLRLFGRLAFTGPVRRAFERQASRSQQRRYPGDFVYEIEADSHGHLAMVFSECAINKFYTDQGVEELAPWCNFFDVSYSRLMGMGLDANTTIGQGCDHCRLDYCHGRATRIPPLVAQLER